jgi:hypothetical protein
VLGSCTQPLEALREEVRRRTTVPSKVRGRNTKILRLELGQIVIQGPLPIGPSLGEEPYMSPLHSCACLSTPPPPQDQNPSPRG